MTCQDLVVPTTTPENIGSDGLQKMSRTEFGAFPVEEMNDRLKALSLCGLLNNGADIVTDAASPLFKTPPAGGDTWGAKGSPTEIAILRACTGLSGGVTAATTNKTENQMAFSIPFNSENKWMLTIHKKGGSDKE